MEEYPSRHRLRHNGTQSLTQIFHEANPRTFVHRTIPDSCARRVINLHKHACIAYAHRRGAECHEECSPLQLMWIGRTGSAIRIQLQELWFVDI